MAKEKSKESKAVTKAEPSIREGDHGDQQTRFGEA